MVNTISKHGETIIANEQKYEGRSKNFESGYLSLHFWAENVTGLTYVVLF